MSTYFAKFVPILLAVKNEVVKNWLVNVGVLMVSTVFMATTRHNTPVIWYIEFYVVYIAIVVLYDVIKVGTEMEGKIQSLAYATYGILGISVAVIVDYMAITKGTLGNAGVIAGLVFFDLLLLYMPWTSISHFLKLRAKKKAESES